MSAEAEAIVTAGAADVADQPIKKGVDPIAAAPDTTPDNAMLATDGNGKTEQDRAEKILKAKELFSQGSRNFLVKSYDEAADELSQVCQLYEEIYGELADELGQPLLLYAKSLIAMALDENKVIDVPDEAGNDDDEDEEVEDGDGDGDDEEKSQSNGAGSTNNIKKLESIKEGSGSDEADSTGDAELSKSETAAKKPPTGVDEVSSSNGGTSTNDDERPSTSNGEAAASTSNGVATPTVGEEDDQVEDEAEEGVSGSLQLAWEILEAAAKIFSRQGLSGLTYLAEVQTELANIEFENGILDAAREDYEKALKIHGELPNQNRRALAELHYKIGLTYLMQQLNKEGAAALRNSSALIEEEIREIKSKEENTEREKNNMLDLEETKQEILAKIQEIEEMQAQTIAEVRAALDSYIKPMSSSSSNGEVAASSSTSSTANGATSSSSSSSTSIGTAAGTSAPSSSAISSSSTKPTDITHLIKRKKPEEPSSEAEALCSPAKRPAI